MTTLSIDTANHSYLISNPSRDLTDQDPGDLTDQDLDDPVPMRDLLKHVWFNSMAHGEDPRAIVAIDRVYVEDEFLWFTIIYKRADGSVDEITDASVLEPHPDGTPPTAVRYEKEGEIVVGIFYPPDDDPYWTAW